MNNIVKIQNEEGQQFCQKGLDEWTSGFFAPTYNRVTLELVEKCPLPDNPDAGPGYEATVEEDVDLEGFDDDAIVAGVKGITLKIQHTPGLPGVTGDFNITCGTDTDQGVAFGPMVSNAICHANRVCLEEDVIWKNGKTFGELKGEATNCPPCGQRNGSPYCSYDCCNAPGQSGNFGCSDGGNAMAPVVQKSCPRHGVRFIASDGDTPEKKKARIEGKINTLMQVDCNRKVDELLKQFRSQKRPSKFSRGAITVKVEVKGKAKCFVDEAEQSRDISHIASVTIPSDSNVATVESVPVLKSYKMDPFRLDFSFGGTCIQNLVAFNTKVSRTNPMRLPKVYGSVVYGFPCYNSRIFPDPTGEGGAKNYTIEYIIIGDPPTRGSTTITVAPPNATPGKAKQLLREQFPGQNIRIISCTASEVPSFEGIQYDQNTKKYTFRAFSPDARSLSDTLGNSVTCGDAHLWSQLRSNQLDDVIDVTECYQAGVLDRQGCIQRILLNANVVKPLESLNGDSIMSPIVDKIQNAIRAALSNAITAVNQKGRTAILNMCGVENCASGVEILSAKLDSITYPIG